MFCVVIRSHDGQYYREEREDKPSSCDLEYWEEFYSISVDSGPGWHSTKPQKFKAVVVNIFEIE